MTGLDRIWGGALKTLENDFEEFLDKGNLEIDSNNSKIFVDKKYNFYFPHDIHINFEQEYPTIKEKYMRRIARFRKKRIMPTCYIRIIESDKEVDYIFSHVDFINDIIKKYNKDSMILFITNKSLEVPKAFPFCMFQMNIYRRFGYFREGLRNGFDSCDALVAFCKTHYDIEKLVKNKVFDQEKERVYNEQYFSRAKVEQKALEIIDEMCNENYNMRKTLKSVIKSPDTRVRNTIFVAECDFSKLHFSETIDVYGAGWIGKFFYDKAKAYVSVRQFVDRRPEKEHPDYQGIPIVKLEDYVPDAGRTIVIIPTYDFNEIETELKEKAKGIRINCVRLEDFLREGIPYEKWKELGM